MATLGSRALWDLHRKRAQAAVERLRVAAPRPGMARRDRYAARARRWSRVVGSAFVAGPEVGSRLRSAFDWRAPMPPAPALRVDGWIDPPLYTRTPPLMIDLAAGEQRLRAPVRSTVVIRVAGKGDVAINPGRGLDCAPGLGEPARRPARAALHPRPATPIFRSAPALRAASGSCRGYPRPAARDRLRGPAGGRTRAAPSTSPIGQGRLRHRCGRGARREGRRLHRQARARAGAADRRSRCPPTRRARRDTKRDRRPDPAPLGWRPGEAHASSPRTRPSRKGAARRLDFTPAAAALHQAARPRARRAAPRARARPGRPQARPDRARRAPHRAGAVHPGMGRLHGAAGRGRAAAHGQDRRAPPRGRRLALGDGAADRGRRSLGRRARAARRPGAPARGARPRRPGRGDQAPDAGAAPGDGQVPARVRRAHAARAAAGRKAISRTSARPTAPSRRTTSTACSTRSRR